MKEKKIVVTEERPKYVLNRVKKLFTIENETHSMMKGKTGDEVLVHILDNAKVFTRFLLFFHWYERRYNKEIIISKNILKELHQEIRIRKEELHDEVRDLYLQFFYSRKLKGFSIIHEHFAEMLPGIENYSIEDVLTYPFTEYLIKTFPQIGSVFHYNGSQNIYHNLSIEEQGEFSNKYKSGPLEYKWGIPTFYPYNKLDEYQMNVTYHSLIPVSTKEIENIIRKNKGLPKIGEGWVSETHLFYELKREFDKYEVIHHGKPKWLGLQHLDIYFPQFNIGIEYQGEQHQKPIEFFGGQEAYEKNVARDNRKKKLCDINDCQLIYVYKGYDLERIVSEISGIIRKRSL